MESEDQSQPCSAHRPHYTNSSYWYPGLCPSELHFSFQLFFFFDVLLLWGYAHFPRFVWSICCLFSFNLMFLLWIFCVSSTWELHFLVVLVLVVWFSCPRHHWASGALKHNRILEVFLSSGSSLMFLEPLLPSGLSDHSRLSQGLGFLVDGMTIGDCLRDLVPLGKCDFLIEGVSKESNLMQKKLYF